MGRIRIRELRGKTEKEIKPRHGTKTAAAAVVGWMDGCKQCAVLFCSVLVSPPLNRVIGGASLANTRGQSNEGDEESVSHITPDRRRSFSAS